MVTASLRRYYPVQVVRVRADYSISAEIVDTMSSPSMCCLFYLTLTINTSYENVNTMSIIHKSEPTRLRRISNAEL